jgi:photosystem II stability/assembly factor-like uncharacterized protein
MKRTAFFITARAVIRTHLCVHLQLPTQVESVILGRDPAEGSETGMHLRQHFILWISVALVATVGNALLQSRQPTAPLGQPQAQLENVRDYVAATAAGAPDYAIDGGLLYRGNPGYWQPLPLPTGIVAGALDVVAQTDAPAQAILYVGAANALALYRSEDGGQHWQRGQLTDDRVHGALVGGVTEVAVDPTQQLIYVGTDTAGLFRMRDTGTRLVSTAQLLLSEPVRQIVTDRRGSGLTLMRTDAALYRARDFGLAWEQVDNFQSIPTALALGYDPAPWLYVGTTERGLLRSADGLAWESINRGLGMAPAASLTVDALTVDPVQPHVLTVALHHTPGDPLLPASSRVAQSRDGGATWRELDAAALDGRVTELLPVSGATRGVYALTQRSRTPQPLGNAPVIGARAHVETRPPTTPALRGLLAWLLAGLAALALIFAVAVDFATRPQQSPDPLLRRTR